MNLIKNFSEACALLGLDEKIILRRNDGWPEEDKAALTALDKLLIMTKAQNHGKDGEAIYYPVFYKNHPSGGGFRFLCADRRVTYSIVGSRLCFKTLGDAEAAGQNEYWRQLYEIWQMPVVAVNDINVIAESDGKENI